MLDSPSKGFRPRPVNGPKYVTYVALCGVRVVEQPLRAAFTHSPRPAIYGPGTAATHPPARVFPSDGREDAV
jgi:hypothetical protein